MTSPPTEFGGIFGTLFCVVGLPFTAIVLNLACNKYSCTLWSVFNSSTYDVTYLLSASHVIVVSWILVQLFLSLLPWGKIAEGLPLKNGQRLVYKCNGFYALLVSIASFIVLTLTGYNVQFIADNFINLAISAIIISFILSSYLYMRACNITDLEIADGGNSGYFIYDFFMGRELNPRIGAIDLKFFCELRPGLIGWVMLDLCFLYQSWQTEVEIPWTLFMVTVFHGIYVADALWFEDCVLSTMDIVHDGFGFMLAFGDLVWVPFLYCLQARYLLHNPQSWSGFSLLFIVILNMTGYFIFRLSNSEKNNFRRNPKDPKLGHLRTMSTVSGRKLLISGWWGMCRHPNYLGDLVMALAWSLSCGFHAILPYFYPVYFLILLIHRTLRDEEHCRKKYGPDWERYCEKVPYRIFPGIF